MTASLASQLNVALTGLLFQLTVIVGVGPQNIVLLKQGVRRWGIGLVVTVFIIGDLLLLPLGTAGVSVVVEQMPLLIDVLRWAGVAYLLWFASTCLRDVRNPTPIDTTGGRPSGEDAVVVQSPDSPDDLDDEVSASDGSRGGTAVATRTRIPLRTRATTRVPALAALPTALAVTFLNPSAWVDGIMVFGTMSNQYGDIGKWAFTAGALVGSVLFFVGVGYGARLLSRPLSKTSVWRWINLGIGVLMIAMAIRLAMMG
ncbi:MAG TPA: LysE family transporter [Candidatus Corynebacterium avicola]|uniref:LysE family transporter n=1 Tax=Candidatus Corynebacterium avicola TaxID=2838527 RepID=A0A9D1RP99_9CORY|nr:LysE family transporter [Candidatus Corynebacterium avicola]